ncbi:RNA-binding S4 domain-containing protein [Qipengyuania spongiae]|uniref:RNA-binding S4 domain-containing protein n=1 Tax=Qipengyuania spongiae TaxID=2909673 RepID=A0ABY5SZM8_9SPHN|nr:S4 domain-containing protein [Qipengyuania spongiae]UVI39967.1 RNA-binding S4 domain-containing protein [Qipengyuania spongiae]
MRIDRLLCMLRFCRTRSRAASLVGEGHLRRNGERVVRASQPVAVGDVLTIPVGNAVRLVEVLALPDRRGPPSEAQSCYRVLDPKGQSAIAADRDQTFEGKDRS